MSGSALAIWTIGHGARPSSELVALLREHAITCVSDVRRHPQSRRHPHFSRQRLADSLASLGVRYEHRAGLGGMREPDGSRTNAGLRARPLRGYADYMQTAAFGAELAALVALAREQPTAILCAEAAPGDCHRSLIADALAARGIVVRHMVGGGLPQRHLVSAAARIEGTRVTYPPRQTELGIAPAGA